MALEHCDTEFGVDLERRLFMHAFGIADRAQDGLYGEGAVRGDHLRQFQRFGQCLPVGYDVADEPDLFGFGGANVPAGQQDVGGDGVRNLADQSHGRPAERKEAPLGLGDTEFGALAGNSNVGALQNLGSTRDGWSFDGCDQGLGEPAALEQRLDLRHVPAAGAEAVARMGGRHGFEIGSGAERATRAGEDGHADVGIAVDPVPGVAHDRHHLARQGVACFGPVHRHDQYVTALLDECVGGGCSGGG
ncbi:hypothetical protein BJF84_04160 [Rhodococcus sp. CUA-806]|nr:hypothetical protein BJF84_04160 [Rhodococcus sp. CUA-806]